MRLFVKYYAKFDKYRLYVKYNCKSVSIYDIITVIIKKRGIKMKCPNCNSENENNSKFCTACGSPMPQPFAQNNGCENAQYPPQQQYQYAYTPVGTDPQGAPYPQPQQPQPQYQPCTPAQPYQPQQQVNGGGDKKNKQKKPTNKKGLKIAIAVIVAAIVVGVVVLLVVLFGGKKEETTKPMVYYTDSRLFVVQSLGADEAKTFEVTNDYGGNYELSEDSKYIVYTTDEEEQTDSDGSTSYTYSIYCKEIENEQDDGTLIAKDASMIKSVLGSIDKIIYTKSGNVYSSDADGNSSKLVDNAFVSDFSKDKSYFIAAKYNEGEYDQATDEYGESSYDLYSVDLSTGERNKIVEEVQDYDFCNQNDTVFYKKNNSLYSASAKDASSKKIADKIDSFTSENGKVYYSVCDKKYTYYDLINDSMKDKDAKAKKPNWDDYEPNIEKYQKQETDVWGTYSTTDYDAYQAAYEKAQKKYDQAYSDYQSALDRNDLREELKANSSYSSYSLYNESGEKIASDLTYSYTTEIYDLPSNNTKPEKTEYIRFMVYDTPLNSMKKVDITKITDSESAETQIVKSITTHDVIYTGNKSISLQKKDNYCSTVNYNPNSSSFVVTFVKNYDSNSDDNSYDDVSVYTLSEKADSMSDAEVIAENIYLCFYTNGEFMTLDDFDGDSNHGGTLHIKDKEIDDAAAFGVFYDPEEKDTYYYATDYNEKTYECNIYKYSNGNTEKVADDVVDWSFGKYDGKFYAITDYDTKEFCGDLICINGDNTYVIDKNVKGIDNNQLGYSSTLSAGDGE